MGRRVKSQLPASALSLYRHWASRVCSPLELARIRHASHAKTSHRRNNASEFPARDWCSIREYNPNQFWHTRAYTVPVAVRRREESSSNGNCKLVGSSSKCHHCCVVEYKKWGSERRVEEKPSHRHLFMTNSWSGECRQSAVARYHSIPVNTLYRNFASSSHGEGVKNILGTAQSAEESTADNGKTQEFSFAAATENESFQGEGFGDTKVGDGDIEVKADGEVDIHDTDDNDDDDDDDDDSLLEKAEHDYLETLGKGEVAELDVKQLEELLGHATGEDVTVGILYVRLGQEYDANGESAEHILRCGQKALAIFQTQTTDVRLEVAMALHLIGIAYFNQEKFEMSLPVLRQAIELFESKGGEDTKAAKCAVRFLLGEALFSWGKADEALRHLKLAVSEQESILGHDHVQLAKGYRKLAEVLANVMKHDEALSFAKKALEIHIKTNGENSMDEAIDRRLLAVIYIGLEEHDKALIEHKIVRDILATSEHGSQTVFVDISTADTEMTLGKYDDAIASLETALSRSEKGSAMHGLALVNLAKVYERKKQPDVANKYAKEVLGILESRTLAKTDPLAVAEGFTELATLYEKINQTPSAIEMLKRAHAIYDGIPHQQNASAGTQAQIGMLLFFTGKVDEAVPYLEKAVTNLEGAVGEQNFALAMVLNHLGVANVELERLEAATEHFERAKGIFIEVLGSDHDDTIAVSRNLVNTYSLLDRLDDAIRCQTEVVNELKDKGIEAKELFEDAIGHLQMLRDHKESGRLMSETLETDPRKFGRIISD